MKNPAKIYEALDRHLKEPTGDSPKPFTLFPLSVEMLPVQGLLNEEPFVLMLRIGGDEEQIKLVAVNDQGGARVGRNDVKDPTSLLDNLFSSDEAPAFSGYLGIPRVLEATFGGDDEFAIQLFQISELLKKKLNEPSLQNARSRWDELVDKLRKVPFVDRSLEVFEEVLRKPENSSLLMEIGGKLVDQYPLQAPEAQSVIRSQFLDFYGPKMVFPPKREGGSPNRERE